MKQNSKKRTMAFAVAMMLTMGMSMSVWADEADDYREYLMKILRKKAIKNNMVAMLSMVHGLIKE